jgi:hypothetical protein
MYAGRENCSKKVEEAIRVHQDNDEAVAFGLAASQILEEVLMGSSISEALEKCKANNHKEHYVNDAISKATDESNELLTDLLGGLGKMGRSGANPYAFIGAMHQLASAAGRPSSDSRELYGQAIRDNIRAGGDSCSRGAIVGAILGAATGGPPTSWVEKVDAHVISRIRNSANAIADIAVGGRELKEE